MKKFIFCLVTAFCVLSLAAANITVADGKKSAYTVVLPDTSGDKYLNIYVDLAGEMIKSVIQKASGAQLKLVKESAFDGKGPAIFVGNTKALAKVGLSSKGFDLWEHVIAVKGKDIYIFGLDLPSPFKHNKSYTHMSIGTLKGACVFAEKFANTRFIVCRKRPDKDRKSVV